ncbi:hypothetical protein ANN_16891 [Periplaneta americana]|uniref:Reverse transcriptase domain-containing protein n=1 Tax=Periplaneta americana TaxID=6978 RepID=A0ABQ8SSH5_PERAM|nr:hypothetical protein ANN_16891 [Periplaneta americana]
MGRAGGRRKRPSGRPIRRWKDNSKMDLGESMNLCENTTKHALRSSFVYGIDSQLKMAAPFKRFGEANISGKEFHVFQNTFNNAIPFYTCVMSASLGVGGVYGADLMPKLGVRVPCEGKTTSDGSTVLCQPQVIREHKLRVFENKVLRIIFGAKRDEVTGEWRKLHNAELHALYSSPDIIRNIKSRRLRWAGHVARMEECRNAYRVLVGDRREKDLRGGRDAGFGIERLHQLLVYADDVNMLGENTQTIRENTEILLESSKAIGLEVNLEKTKYMIMSRDQNIVRNGHIKIGDLSFEEVEKFKYLGATVTNINDTREEIKRRINMGNACYYSVEKLLSSSLLSKNLKVIIYKTVILPVLLYGCETWTLTLREEHRLRVFENKVLRKIFGAKRDEVTGEWRRLRNAELHALYSSPDIIRNIKSRRLRWARHVARMGESRNAYRVLVGRREGKRPLGRPRRRWEDNIKFDLREVGYDDGDRINLA